MNTAGRVSDVLAKVIATVESGPFPYAMRFEWPMYNKIAAAGGADHNTIAAIMAANHCTPQTAEVIYCISFGLFQIMGFNLYGPLGLTIAIAPFMFDTEQQFNAFKKFVRLNGFDPDNFDFTDEALIERFARSYNGSGDVANYSAKMKAAFAQLPK